MMVKGVIFDLDGTLLDSMHAWDNIGATFLVAQGIQPPKDLAEILKTMSFNESAQYFIDHLGVTLTPTEIISGFNQLVEDRYRDTLELKPFAKEYLGKLNEKGIKMCIATETDKSLAEKALLRLGILDYFSFILTSKEVGLGKNNTKIFDTASHLLNLNRNEIIIFEDALYAIKTAKSAGYYVVGVYDSTASQDTEEIISVTDHYIKSFEEMKS